MKQVEFGDKNINLRWAGVKEYFWKHLEEVMSRSLCLVSEKV